MKNNYFIKINTNINIFYEGITNINAMMSYIIIHKDSTFSLYNKI